MRLPILFIISALSLSPYVDEVTFKSPVDEGNQIVSKFGMRTHPVLMNQRMHNGVDYKLEEGTKVYAASEGKITFIGEKGDYGNVITIAHDQGFETMYTNLSAFGKELAVGDKVKQGDEIARSGNSGLSSAPHLHFEIRKDGQAVDPEDYLSNN
jgi:murein DD-endopeptidase MepM/ murein hydrolase activator NlpD